MHDRNTTDVELVDYQSASGVMSEMEEAAN
jgi:hypothetical protein